MRRKNKKIAKTANKKLSSSLSLTSSESDRATGESLVNFKRTNSNECKSACSSEPVEEQSIELSTDSSSQPPLCGSYSSSSSSSSDLPFNADTIKLEKQCESSPLETNFNEEIKSLSSEQSIETANASTEQENISYLFVELKMTSIDKKCTNYKDLSNRFLCVDSNASLDHLRQLIIKKMLIPQDLFEVSQFH
jgi:hypothetical protein